MSRRASLPGAAELFRTTSAAEAAPLAAPAAPHPGVGAVPPVRELAPRDTTDTPIGVAPSEVTMIAPVAVVAGAAIVISPPTIAALMPCSAGICLLTTLASRLAET